MRNAYRLLPGIAFGLSLASCVAPDDVQELKKNQKKILTKLEEMEKKVAAGGRAAPQAPRRRPGSPDPSKVYAFELGDAPVKGPKDAWVTVVEVSDFQ